MTKMRSFLACIVLLALAAVDLSREPIATGLFLIILVVILVWHVIGWKTMSREKRAKLAFDFKTRHGIPQNQPHKVDELLRK